MATTEGPSTPTATDIETLAALVGGTLRARAAGTAEPPAVTRLVAPERWSRRAAETGPPEVAAVVVLGADSDAAAATAAWGRASPAVLVARVGAVPAAYAGAVLEVGDPRLALARLSAHFDRRPRPVPGVHPTAVVDPTARIGRDVSVEAGAVIGPAAEMGDACAVGANCVIGPGVHVGAGSRLYANVTLYDGVTLGARVIVHSGAVLGADGFGYAAGPAGAAKIHHTGGVVIGDDVEIGALTAIDRGTLEDTRVGARTKIDNHCQIGHNVQIGSDCLLAGMTAVAGSAVLEDGVVLGGAAAISDHVTVHAGARIAGRSGVTKDVPAGETWAGFPARPYRRYVRELYLLDRLERIWEVVRAVAKAPSGGSGDAARSGRDDARTVGAHDDPPAEAAAERG